MQNAAGRVSHKGDLHTPPLDPNQAGGLGDVDHHEKVALVRQILADTWPQVLEILFKDRTSYETSRRTELFLQAERTLQRAIDEPQDVEN